MDTFYPAPDDPARLAAFYAAHGAHAPGSRVWVDGVDVTDTMPPENWPWPFNLDAPRPKPPGKRSRKR